MQSFKEFINENSDNKIENKSDNTEINEADIDKKLLSDTQRTIDNYYRGLIRSFDYVRNRDVGADIANRCVDDRNVLTQLYATKYVYDELKYASDVQSCADAITNSSFFKQIKDKDFKNHVIYALRYAGAKV